MKVFIRNNLVPALLAMIIFIVTLPFVESLHRLYDQTVPAIEWYSGRAVNSPVRPGEVLHIVYKAKINKQCPSDIRSFIRAEDGSVPVRFPVLAGGYTPPTKDVVDIKVNIQIPLVTDFGLEPFKSGKHEYQSLVTRYCSSGVEQDSNVPSIPFMLEVPK